MTKQTPPITLETLNAFLIGRAWWEFCDKQANRFAYRVVKKMAEQKAAEQLAAAGRVKSWAQREDTRK